MHVLLFYDDLRASRERDAINNKVAAKMAEILEKKVYTENLVKEAGKYLIVEEASEDPITKRKFTVKRNTKVIQEEIDRTGYFLMATNGDDGPAFEIRVARLRDRNEKSYRRRKTFFKLATPGTGTNDTYNGKMIVADIAQSIEEAMEYYAESYINKKSSETFVTTVNELHKIKMRVKEDGSMKLAYPLTKDQKDLLKCFDLDALDFEEYVRSLHWGKGFGEVHNRSEKKKAERDRIKAEKAAKKEAEKTAKKAAREAEKAAKKAAKKPQKKTE